MELVALARRIALAFASGESNDALADAVQAIFPSAAYVSLSLCGSTQIAVATSNLAARGFMTQSLLGTDRCPALLTGRPQLVPVSRSMGFVPLDSRLKAGRFLCIPIPTLPDTPVPEGGKISGLVETPGGMIGCLVLGLAPERPEDSELVSNAAELVRALAAELPGGAVRAAQDIVSCVLPVNLGGESAAAPTGPAAAPADAAAAPAKLAADLAESAAAIGEERPSDAHQRRAMADAAPAGEKQTTAAAAAQPPQTPAAASDAGRPAAAAAAAVGGRSLRQATACEAVGTAPPEGGAAAAAGRTDSDTDHSGNDSDSVAASPDAADTTSSGSVAAGSGQSTAGAACAGPCQVPMCLSGHAGTRSPVPEHASAEARGRSSGGAVDVALAALSVSGQTSDKKACSHKAG